MRRAVVVSVVVAVLGAGLVGTGVGGAQEAGCTSVPIAVVAGGPDAPGSPGTDRVHAYGAFPFPISSGPDAVDLDGDDAADPVLVQPDGSVTLQLAGGDLTFAVAGSALWAGGVGSAPLDGMADDLVVFEVEGDGDSTPLPTGRSWIIRDPLAPGIHDPRSVGVEVDGGAAFTGADRDGDGVEDLLMVSFAAGGDPHRGTTRVVSGAAVDAAPAGSAVPASATLSTVPGVLDGFARIDGEDLTDPEGIYRREGRIVTRTRTAGGWELRVSDGSVVRTYTTGTGGEAATFDDRPVVFAWVAAEGTYLSASMFETTYWWDLDTCVAPTSTTTTTVPAPATAPAAQPITAAAQLTG